MASPYKLYPCILVEGDNVLMEGLISLHELEQVNKAYEREGSTRRWKLKQEVDIP